MTAASDPKAELRQMLADKLHDRDCGCADTNAEHMTFGYSHDRYGQMADALLELFTVDEDYQSIDTSRLCEPNGSALRQRRLIAATAAEYAQRQASKPGAGSRAWWDARREQLCEWARANGLDPDDIPASAEFVVHGGKVTVDVVARRADGSIAVDRGRPLLTKKTVPLRVPFPD